MGTIYILTSILQVFAVAVGVGASTVSVGLFFTALSDGTIDDTERRLMHVGYRILRVAMIVLVSVTFIQGVVLFIWKNGQYFIPHIQAIWFLIIVLFVNASLMTAHKMPSVAGPALQATTWYALGLLFSLTLLTYAVSSFMTFFIWYLLGFALVFVAFFMTYAYQKSHNAPTSATIGTTPQQPTPAQ